MHGGARLPQREGMDDVRFRLGEELEARFDVGASSRAFDPDGHYGEVDVLPVVTSLAGEELFVERSKIGRRVRGKDLDEELEALARTRLDERAEQQAIDDEREG